MLNCLAARARGGRPPRLRDTNFGSRSLEASVDFNNISNANTFWDARTLSGTINLRQNGGPAGAINTLPHSGSPAVVSFYSSKSCEWVGPEEWMPPRSLSNSRNSIRVRDCSRNAPSIALVMV